jgi:hypothetical protein
MRRSSHGAATHTRHCAVCHGADLSGDPDWKTPNEDGSYRPPPHDPSGHTWHHPDRALIGVIRDGSDFPQSRMRAFGDRLDEAGIAAILEWINSHRSPGAGVSPAGHRTGPGSALARRCDASCLRHLSGEPAGLVDVEHQDEDEHGHAPGGVGPGVTLLSWSAGVATKAVE